MPSLAVPSPGPGMMNGSSPRGRDGMRTLSLAPPAQPSQSPLVVTQSKGGEKGPVSWGVGFFKFELKYLALSNAILEAGQVAAAAEDPDEAKKA